MPGPPSPAPARPRADLLAAAGEPVAGVRRIAVLRANAIGDFVLAVPALEALRAAYPHAELTVLGAGWHPGLLAGRPGPWDRVLSVPGAPDLRPGDVRMRRFLARRRAEGVDLALQLHGGGAQSNPVTSALGARVTAGSRAPGAPELDRWLPYRVSQHETLRLLEVVGLVGAAPVRLEPRLAVTAADRRAADEVLAGLPGVGGHPLVAVHPGARDPRRRWPAERFAELARALVAGGATVLVIGGDGNDRAVAAVVAQPPGVHDLTGRLGLPATLGVLQRCDLMIGNDSGPHHLAMAVGVDTVGIYWCGNLIDAGPLSRARHRVAVSFTSRCPVCDAPQDTRYERCPHDPSFVADVPLDQVLAEAADLLRLRVPQTA